MKKIYISGQITGLPLKEVQTKFREAERILTEQGYEVISPLKNGIPYHFPWKFHIVIDLFLLMGCEAVYFLPDWNISKGATLEKTIAELTGKELIYQQAPIFVELKRAISEIMQIQFYDITGKDRSQEKVFARMIYAHFCSQQGASITDIASEIRHDHSTISYYLRKFEDEKKFNPKFSEIANRIENILIPQK
jgi:hypothetical protein